MRFYLANRYSRRAETLGYKKEMERHGYEVTSRWVDQDEHGEGVHDAVSPLIAAATDLNDLERADVLVMFGNEPGTGKGGRHVEFGVALATGKTIFLVGEPENVFSHLANYKMNSWAECFAFIQALYVA